MVDRLRRMAAVGSAYPPRLRRLAFAVIAAASPVVAGAAARAASHPMDRQFTLAVALFLVLALGAELRPVPIDAEGGRLVSVAVVFVVSATLVLGWEWGVLIGAASIAIAQVPSPADVLKFSFNVAVYALAAALSALPMLGAGQALKSSTVGAICVAFASGALFVSCNVALVCGAISLAADEPFRAVVRDHFRHSGPAFSVMVFVIAQAVIFWKQSPYLLILAGAPLFALNLYQRAAVKRRLAEREAARDGLTKLGNYRAYQVAVTELAEIALASGSSLTLYLVDVDRFKQVNDRYGHPAGDTVLQAIGNLIEEIAPGAGYRLGGDEFAIVMPDSIEPDFPARFHDHLASLSVAGVGEPVTVSIGAAQFPEHATEPSELKKRADLALYQSKRNGKNQTRIFHADSFEIELNGERDPSGLVAACRLIAVVSARDKLTGEHSLAVACLARSIGARLGLDVTELDGLYLAGLLHDLGKVAISDLILQKPTLLTGAELETVKEHTRVGYELLTGLGLEPVDDWILHHHERWDGYGYPHGLEGAEIPFGSRILHVADAFDAMTTDRPYRRALSIPAALGEVRDNAGTQFDPLVVAALEDCLAARPVEHPLAAGQI
jgi:diguanylate cyclase (GGDEF)-like protein/putative nucleotidyltransferase with HDIG domain